MFGIHVNASFHSEYLTYMYKCIYHHLDSLLYVSSS